ncbi:16S rRNA (guanine(966)-N(2))-methyltransferase RsmD [Mesonia maritima]|uniref:16S rRNA (Guanine(966)-N(2))-methyltransferase RsmD n=1 Tax=Mesonia maritima TaxID=1793873 RepID=A0ABU1K544_9FLAO|nr:16S rRNA (guanine(966)-N(2))-methyltransferase RsmD [Mesonia maritima]MDR6300734.1 16S rRNA (guanine(966)-N(2))-methyltransferase RsmD [Mesonia maritima]
MRIISGKHKGKRITAPKKLPIRPTKDMAKEALFNILVNRFQFSTLKTLDLFAGSGNISYEFSSRGVQNLTAVDSNFACVKFIEQTAKSLEAEINTIKSDVFSYLEKSPQQFDIIFADPPYDFETEKFQTISNLIFENNLLAEDGLLIIEHSKHTDLSTTKNFQDSRKYGGSVFSFFQN